MLHPPPCSIRTWLSELKPAVKKEHSYLYFSLYNQFQIFLCWWAMCLWIFLKNDSVGKSQCTGTWDKVVMWVSAKSVEHCAKGKNQRGKYVYLWCSIHKLVNWRFHSIKIYRTFMIELHFTWWCGWRPLRFFITTIPTTIAAINATPANDNVM